VSHFLGHSAIWFNELIPTFMQVRCMDYTSMQHAMDFTHVHVGEIAMP
jgi:hypothetical protein